jgi:hypothetical protein
MSSRTVAQNSVSLSLVSRGRIEPAARMTRSSGWITNDKLPRDFLIASDPARRPFGVTRYEKSWLLGRET